MGLRQRCMIGAAAVAMMSSTGLGAQNATAAFGSAMPKHETISDIGRSHQGRFGMPCMLPDNLRARVIGPAVFYAERHGELREFVEGIIARYSRHLDLNHVWIGPNRNVGVWGAIRFEDEKTAGNAFTVASVKLTITINFYGKLPTARP
ncbi:MAG: hypothetical protein PHV13_05285 [Candidatus ainarchaeum sp.]|nr:hypothetical protein [Candidatus ainarchaeum sp.]